MTQTTLDGTSVWWQLTTHKPCKLVVALEVFLELCRVEPNKDKFNRELFRHGSIEPMSEQDLWDVGQPRFKLSIGAAAGAGGSGDSQLIGRFKA